MSFSAEHYYLQETSSEVKLILIARQKVNDLENMNNFFLRLLYLLLRGNTRKVPATSLMCVTRVVIVRFADVIWN